MREIAPFSLRFPSDLKKKINAYAKKNRRSINSEVLAQIETVYAALEATQAKGRIENFTTGELIDELKRRLGDDMIVHIEIGKKE